MKYAPFFLVFVLLASSASGPTELPASVDWRGYGAVTPVRNMAACGADYAFAAAEALESAVAIKGGPLKPLSTQELVECSNVDGNHGCEGGTVEGAYKWVISHGLVASVDYPYTGRVVSCRLHAAPAAHMNSTRAVATDEDSLMRAVAQQPVAALIAIASDFGTYGGGLYPCHASSPWEHWVVIVGYGKDAAGRPYWLIKNAMGTEWGEHGYIRIPRARDCPNVKRAVVPVV